MRYRIFGFRSDGLFISISISISLTGFQKMGYTAHKELLYNTYTYMLTYIHICDSSAILRKQASKQASTNEAV